MDEKIMVLVTIVERREGSGMAALYAENGLDFHYQCSGRGTASSELLDVLGFGTAERDILISFGREGIVRSLMYRLNDELRARARAKGIAFSACLTGMNRLAAAALLQKEDHSPKEGEISMEKTSANSLILIAVNQGHTDEVMETAKKAGARGGTVIRARWAGSKESEQFYGITLQEEKEILAIVVTAQTRNHIMETLNKVHGLRSEAGG